jgi:hypothetical protein
MSDIKPVAVITIDYYRGYIGYQNVNTELNVDLPEGRHDVYIIPSTHRIVPVDLLSDACCFLSRGFINSEVSEKLHAIIDKEPTK